MYVCTGGTGQHWETGCRYYEHISGTGNYATSVVTGGRIFKLGVVYDLGSWSSVAYGVKL